MITNSAITISFVVPALNEEAVVQAVIERILEQVAGRFADYELILVDDGSTDATGQIMDQLSERHARVRVIHNARNMGLGAAYKRGIQEARFDYLMLLCGDGGLPASSLPTIFEAIGRADIVVPYITNLQRIKTPFRYALSRTYSKLLNALFGFQLRYYNGLPVHRTDLLRSIEITSHGFGFQGEVLVKLLKSGCSYVEVGVAGAEETRRSFALRPKNIASVARTFVHLVWEIAHFTPIKVRPIGDGMEIDTDGEIAPDAAKRAHSASF